MTVPRTITPDVQAIAQAVAHLAQRVLRVGLDPRGQHLGAVDRDRLVEQVARPRAGNLAAQPLDLALQCPRSAPEARRPGAGTSLQGTRSSRPSSSSMRCWLQHPRDRALAGQRLDPADAGGDAAFGGDHERADFARAADVRAAAELLREAGDLTTRTVSPYFSPKSAIAPSATASSYGLTSAVDRRCRPGSRG